MQQMAALYASEGADPNKDRSMKTKAFEILETKTAEGSGEFTALVSVFGNVDHVGDRMVHGAFKNTLNQWRKSGDPIPVILSHSWDDPMAHIGVADPNQVMETNRGLVVKGTLDIEDNPVAKQVHKLMKRRSLKEFSFGYTVPDGGEETSDDGAMDVTEVSLIEVGPTLKGANPSTELLAVKSAMGVEEQEATDSTELRRRTFEGSSDYKPTEEDNALLDEVLAKREALAASEEKLAAAEERAQAAEGQVEELAMAGVPSEEELRRRTAAVRFDGKAEVPAGASELMKETLALREEVHELRAQREKDGAALKETLAVMEQLQNTPSEEVLRRKTAANRLVETSHSAAEAELRQEIEDLKASREENDKLLSETVELVEKLKNTPTEEELRRKTAALTLERAEVVNTKDGGGMMGDGGGSEDTAVSVLSEMISYAQDYIDSEPDPEDAATMRNVLKALSDLLSKDVGESGKALWSTAFVNNLPDSAFLHIEPGGSKDSEGKTKPRSLRHFPYKGPDGSVDLPHLRNALSRIPQAGSWLSQAQKDELTATARRILDNAHKSLSRIEDGSDEEPSSAKSEPQDSLKRRSDELALELARGDLRDVEVPKAEPEPEPLNEAELRRRAFDLMLEIANG